MSGSRKDARGPTGTDPADKSPPDKHLPDNGSSGRIVLGHVVGVHGIKGDVLLKVYTEAAEDIASYGALTDESGGRQFELGAVRVTGKGVVAHIKGINDRTAAEALRGTALTILREKLPDPEDESWYHVDLVGLKAVDASGSELGSVIAVHNFGAGDLLEISLLGKTQTALVPLKDEFVPVVDIAGQRVVIAPVPGLLD